MDIIFECTKTLHPPTAGKHNPSHTPFRLEVSQTLHFGDFLALFGKSGAGKTTLLRILAGLTQPDSGYIKVGDEVWQDGRFSLPPQKRRIGFMFQDYALFPHLNVEQNITFALEDKKNLAFVHWLIEIMEITPILKHHTSQISGGQAQRVALARALARKPKILLLDEPLSALDSAMRLSLQNTIATLHQQLGLSTILISHEITEIMRLCSKVWCIEEGRVSKSGSIDEIFGSRLSGKVQLSGEILRKVPQGVVEIIDVVCGSQVVRVLYPAREAQEFAVGDKVLIVSKAFNPLLFKISL